MADNMYAIYKRALMIWKRSKVVFLEQCVIANTEQNMKLTQWSLT